MDKEGLRRLKDKLAAAKMGKFSPNQRKDLKSLSGIAHANY